MKKPRHNIKATGRKRRTLGWTLLTLGMLVAGMWAASGWWTLGYGWAAALPLGGGVRQGQVRVHIGSGRVSVLQTDLPDSLAQFGLPFKSGWGLQPTASIERTLMWRALTEQMRQSDAAISDYGLIAFFDDDPTGVYVYKGCIVVLWPVPLLMLGGGALLLWRGIRARRRAMTHLCRTCGYDLGGLGAGASAPSAERRAL